MENWSITRQVASPRKTKFKSYAKRLAAYAAIGVYIFIWLTMLLFAGTHYIERLQVYQEEIDYLMGIAIVIALIGSVVLLKLEKDTMERHRREQKWEYGCGIFGRC